MSEQKGELSTAEIGRKGELTAVQFLEKKGFRILDTNWQCEFGEMDIVAWDPNGTLAFIEVKTRRSISAGLPEVAVTSKKRRKIERVAMSYLNQNIKSSCPVRFDIFAVCVIGPHKVFVRHDLGAFEAEGEL